MAVTRADRMLDNSESG